MGLGTIYKKSDTRASTFRVSFMGRQAVIFLENYREFFKAVGHDGRAEAAVDAFIECWNVIATPCDASSPERRSEKSNAIQASGAVFVNAFATLVSRSDVSWYMRLLLCEIPRVVLECPVDISLASGQSIERVNQVVKKHATKTNHQFKAPKGRKVKNYAGFFIQLATQWFGKFSSDLNTGFVSRHFANILRVNHRAGSKLNPIVV